jgi:hypothetical protein
VSSKFSHNLSQFRVQPYPDPDRVEQTEWLSKEELSAEAFKPSKKWAEAGNGDVGHVYVEVIGCKDLPNMVGETSNASIKRT